METLELALHPDPEPRLAALLAARASPVRVALLVADLHRPAPADLQLLARLALAGRRAGHRMVLRGAGPRLRLLLRLTGLAEALPVE
ncbi:hypothetical protein HUT16_35875 [Kitasatospora sp. NA04385]|uniref:hypothetical protein n=1 Tax=Kitasatospora sp. NA04385 TaxID=2742135 RepID=UPI001591E2AF|nr:hypothetical protein [Kitasatospora sp. NA04385]QKW23768.1 hypothetical protein HUT16_35875 [Kitasatospora sp. NA04385]